MNESELTRGTESSCPRLSKNLAIGLMVMALVSGATLAAAILLVVVLYHLSNAFRYYARFTIFTLLSLIFASIFIPLMLFRPRDAKNALMPAWGGRQISRVLGLRWELRGLEHAVNDTGCVVLINHQSALDLLVLAELWPKLPRCTVISKKEVFYLWPFGLACWLWGTIFIDRLNVAQAQNTINSTASIIKSKRSKLLMFPEGTRNSGPALLPFKKGAFHVAIASQTPIQPIVVSKYYFLDSKKKMFSSGNNIIQILPPIPTEGLTKDDLGILIEKTRNTMIEAQAVVTKQALAAAAKKKD